MALTRFGRNAGLFYGVMFGAFFASPYSNLYFLLLGFLTLLGLGGLLAARRNLAGLGAQLGPVASVPSESTARITLTLRAPRRARFGLRAVLPLADDGAHLAGRIDLLEGSGELTLETKGLARGVYPLRELWLESEHPFGLVRLRRHIPVQGELVVYPAPHDARGAQSQGGASDDFLGPDAQPGDVQPAGLRDHRTGDGQRAIHWRASARRARLVVQEWEAGRSQGLEVLLDRRCATDELEQALRTVSALVQLARTHKESLRLHSQDHVVTYGEGQRPLAEALRFLAAAEALPVSAAPPPAVSPTVLRLPRARAHAG